MVLRSTRNLLFFLACPQMWVHPRKLKVAGLPFPRCFRLDATKRRASRTLTRSNYCGFPTLLSTIESWEGCKRYPLRVRR
jgi:hypothetical protein